MTLAGEMEEYTKTLLQDKRAKAFIDKVRDSLERAVDKLNAISAYSPDLLEDSDSEEQAQPPPPAGLDGKQGFRAGYGKLLPTVRHSQP